MVWVGLGRGLHTLYGEYVSELVHGTEFHNGAVW